MDDDVFNAAPGGLDQLGVQNHFSARCAAAPPGGHLLQVDAGGFDLVLAELFQ